MRILLTANASYVPPRGGATRSNLIWLDQLVRNGHQCRIVAGRVPDAEREIAEQEIRTTPAGPNAIDRDGILVFAAAEPPRQAALLREQIRSFAPDWVLVSSEDVGHVLLREAHDEAPGRVVFLAHTPQFFPFGPQSWNPDPQGPELVSKAALVVVIGQHMAGYVRQYAGCEAAVIHPPIYGAGPFPILGQFDAGLVTMINPCGVKGISIFLALADRFPDVQFGALPGWGTTKKDLRELGLRRNIVLLRSSRSIDDLLRTTRILLMPSLWYEGFGLIVMEAMLRGLPVIASDSGGLIEAKESTGYVIPVSPIERYEPVFDERGMPRAIEPPQDIEPWAAALKELLASRAAYEREAALSREAAVRFVTGIQPGRLEKVLLSLSPRSDNAQVRTGRPALERLSPERRALLLQLLRKQS